MMFVWLCEKRRLSSAFPANVAQALIMSALLQQADAASDKELCGALRIKLDRMKDECDKLAAQLSSKDEAHALLHRKYQHLKQELDDKVRRVLFF